MNVVSKYLVSGSTWHGYTISYAYDEKNRMVFKSFKDTTSGGEAQWYFYWDQFDRLIQTKHVPDITDQNTYSVFQRYWLERRPFLYYQIDYPGGTTTRRYLESDEQGRPLAACGGGRFPGRGICQRPRFDGILYRIAPILDRTGGASTRDARPARRGENRSGVYSSR